MPKLSGQTIYLGAIVALAVAVAGYLVMTSNGQAGVRTLRLADIPFDGERAYGYLRDICDLGVRPSGSSGMAAQQELLIRHFEELGATVRRQEFRGRNPQTGAAAPMANLIVEWHPDRTERILLAAHYDTRPFPDRDRRNPQGVFLGANDGGSGVALLMELGRDMSGLAGDLGVDFVLFDGEELVYSDGDPYFLGSTHFALEYKTNPPAHRYRWGVLLDMIGDADLALPQEGHSIAWPDTRPLVHAIWNKAKELGVREFVHRKGEEVRDDHLALRNTAGIPTCDIIDFSYPHWHTEQDLPKRCSALSLAKVGWVVREWLRDEVQVPARSGE